ncbi:MAG: hypothetical protein L0K86_19635, partial [Actinomycetia bacterium]|nr:hypothetical protein [Actinomycetes bacterium]
MTLARAARRLCVFLSCGLVASSLIAATNVSPSLANPEQAQSARAQDAAAEAAGGMYGAVGGSAVRKDEVGVAGTASGDGYQNWHHGNAICGVYANSAGMGSYCSTGVGGGNPEPLVERYPNWAEFENCRFEDPPKGVDVPTNPEPMEKKWQLRTCLTAINWFSWDGGDSRRIIMDLVLVDIDRDTTYPETPLSNFLWDTVQTEYPVPMLRVQPKTYPVVGQRAYLTFTWLNTKTRKPEKQGPYANSPNGGPFVMHHNGDITMRARAVKMTIDPQIEGVKPFDCTISKLGYVKDAGPDPDDQPSDCYHIFKRSSAAAPEISTAEA